MSRSMSGSRVFESRESALSSFLRGLTLRRRQLSRRHWLPIFLETERARLQPRRTYICASSVASPCATCAWTSTRKSSRNARGLQYVPSLSKTKRAQDLLNLRPEGDSPPCSAARARGGVEATDRPVSPKNKAVANHGPARVARKNVTLRSGGSLNPVTQSPPAHRAGPYCTLREQSARHLASEETPQPRGEP